MDVLTRLPAMVIAALALVLAGCASPRQTTAPAPRESSAHKWLQAQWVVEVLCSAEAGDRKLLVVRWSEPVYVVLNNGSEPQKRAWEKALAQINETLGDEPPIRLVPIGTALNGKKQIHVHHAPWKEWPELGKKIGLPVTLPDKGQDGVHFIRWNPRGELDASIIVIADELQDNLLQHTVLEELYQAMGVRNDSGLYPDSIVYESGGDTGGNVSLSARDRKLLRFLYRHVPPGTRPAELVKLIDEHWNYE